MNKAFIFDMDGVIVNCEPQWEEFKKQYYPKKLGDETYEKMGPTIGMTLDGIYEKAVSLGANIEKESFLEGFFKEAPLIYKNALIVDGIERLTQVLIEQGFSLGLVSASPQAWIDIVLAKLPFKKNIKIILSLNERQYLRPKPYPDGYIEAIKLLESTPEKTIILEDSNRGIQAAKASGAYVIGFKENLVTGYQQNQQTGADVYAENIGDVIEIASSLKL